MLASLEDAWFENVDGELFEQFLATDGALNPSLCFKSEVRVRVTL